MSRFSCPFLRLIYIPLQAMPYYRSAPVSFGQFPRSGSKILFSFSNSDFRAAVPALHNKIGIPALPWNPGLGFGSANSIHDLPPAYGAIDRTHFICQSISLVLLFVSVHHKCTPFRRCRSRPTEMLRPENFHYFTISVSHPATGRDRRRAFRYAISKVRQVLPR